MVITVHVKVFPSQTKEQVLAKLREKKADLMNLYLEEPESFVQEKLGISGYPACFVFDRQGRWSAFGGNNDDYQPFDEEKIQSLVGKLLKEGLGK